MCLVGGPCLVQVPLVGLRRYQSPGGSPVARVLGQGLPAHLLGFWPLALIGAVLDQAAPKQEPAARPQVPARQQPRRERVGLIDPAGRARMFSLSCAIFPTPNWLMARSHSASASSVRPASGQHLDQHLGSGGVRFGVPRAGSSRPVDLSLARRRCARTGSRPGLIDRAARRCRPPGRRPATRRARPAHRVHRRCCSNICGAGQRRPPGSGLVRLSVPDGSIARARMNTSALVPLTQIREAGRCGRSRIARAASAPYHATSPNDASRSSAAPPSDSVSRA